eukprot:TRINITY_DN9878_c1_g1_i1.p1 TRINITY_DN9878_c1_g1~~TRINITY_DN9878_c1_g1_i1.p1  ORF type:complete len:1054 (-),score=212.27 TRINITY_DN9878_c1_g1_i1:5-3088(-)
MTRGHNAALAAIILMGLLVLSSGDICPIFTGCTECYEGFGCEWYTFPSCPDRDDGCGVCASSTNPPPGNGILVPFIGCGFVLDGCPNITIVQALTVGCQCLVSLQEFGNVNFNCGQPSTVAGFCKSLPTQLDCLFASAYCFWNTPAGQCQRFINQTSTPQLPITYSTPRCISCLRSTHTLQRSYGEYISGFSFQLQQQLLLTPPPLTDFVSYDPSNSTCSQFQSPTPSSVSDFWSCWTSSPVAQAFLRQIEKPVVSFAPIQNLIVVLICCVACLGLLALFVWLPMPMMSSVRLKLKLGLRNVDVRQDIVQIAPQPGSFLRHEKTPTGGYTTVALVLGVLIYSIYASLTFNSLSEVTIYEVKNTNVLAFPPLGATFFVALHNTTCQTLNRTVVLQQAAQPGACVLQHGDELPICAVVFRPTVAELSSTLMYEIVFNEGDYVPNDLAFQVDGLPQRDPRAYPFPPSACPYFVPALWSAFYDLSATDQFVYNYTILACTGDCLEGSFPDDTPNTATRVIKLSATPRRLCKYSVFFSATCDQQSLGLIFDQAIVQEIDLTTTVGGYRFEIDLAADSIDTYIQSQFIAGLLLQILGFVGSMLGAHAAVRLVVTSVFMTPYLQGAFSGAVFPFLAFLTPFGLFRDAAAGAGAMFGAALCLASVFVFLSQFGLPPLFVIYNIYLELELQILVLSVLLSLTFYSASTTRERGGVSEAVQGFFVGLLPFVGFLAMIGLPGMTLAHQVGSLVSSGLLMLSIALASVGSGNPYVNDPAVYDFLFYSSAIGIMVLVPALLILTAIVHWQLNTNVIREKGEIWHLLVGFMSGFLLFPPFFYALLPRRCSMRLFSASVTSLISMLMVLTFAGALGPASVLFGYLPLMMFAIGELNERPRGELSCFATGFIVGLIPVFGPMIMTGRSRMAQIGCTLSSIVVSAVAAFCYAGPLLDFINVLFNRAHTVFNRTVFLEVSQIVILGVQQLVGMMVCYMAASRPAAESLPRHPSASGLELNEMTESGSKTPSVSDGLRTSLLDNAY